MLEKNDHASLSDLPAAGKQISTWDGPLPEWLARIALAIPEIEVWQAHLDLGAEQVLQCTALLSCDERLRADRFHFERDRRRFIVARGTLRKLLGSYLEIPSAGIKFGYAKYGKPLVAESPAQIHFNVSHSEERALYAISGKHPVGVDIEYLNRDIEYHGLARRFFSHNEWAALESLPDSSRKRAFFACWTRKEAIVKAIGDGLSLPLDRFEVAIAPDTAPRVPGFVPAACDVTDCTLYSANLDRDYVAAVAAYGLK